MINAIIADDERATAAMIEYFLKASNAPIEIIGIATDGEEAVRLIKTQKPDLAFLDVQMPLLDGFDVMKHVGNEVNFIIITAYDSFRNAQQALRFGAKDILHKPIDSEQLLQAIMRAIGWEFTSNAIVNDLLEFLHKNYAEKISLDLLSEQFHVTISHMARTFKKHTGKSIGSYLNEVRIREAKKMLASPAKSVQEIALLTGYVSVNNFYKYFKAETNMTPAAYRLKHTGSSSNCDGAAPRQV
jgi:Response regulator containing CheY-like receiver domain and AraC-type DNA-binding domain